MFWYLVRLSTGALCGGLYANPLEMAIQSAVACSEAKDDGLLVSRQLMERVLVWVISFSLAVEDGFLFIMDKSFNNNNNNNNRIQRRYSRFFAISSQRRELSPTRTLKWPGHMQPIELLSRASVMLRATWYEGTAQLLSLTELKSHLFELYFIG